MASDHTRSGLRVPHDRRSIRLPGYDYAEPGAYFVTICTRNRRRLFGEITAGKSYLNPMGWLVKRCWLEIPQHFPFVELDAFMIMPDHVHGIIWIESDTVTVDSDTVTVGARDVVPLQSSAPVVPLQFRADVVHPQSHPPPSFGYSQPRCLARIVGSFKAAVTRRCGGAMDAIWQRNYYEHIIRNEDALRRIRRYIETNAERWGKT